ncbi:MAG: DUF2231 domain-containing protein [Pyrinomonadaceae bacterium]
MEARAKMFGHAIHPILIVFPLGLLSTAVVFDVIYLVWGNTLMATVAFWMMAAGIVGGLLAAPFGWIDWAKIPSGTRAKTVGFMHGMTNTVVLLLFVASFAMRYGLPERPEMTASILSFAGLVLALLGGWLGGELVERLGVGVDEGAHLNAPNSLTSDSARGSESGYSKKMARS